MKSSSSSYYSLLLFCFVLLLIQILIQVKHGTLLFLVRVVLVFCHALVEFFDYLPHWPNVEVGRFHGIQDLFQLIGAGIRLSILKFTLIKIKKGLERMSDSPFNRQDGKRLAVCC